MRPICVLTSLLMLCVLRETCLELCMWEAAQVGITADLQGSDGSHLGP